MHWTCCHTADFSAQALQEVYSRLSPTRKVHIDRFHRHEDKLRSLAAEALLQRLLQERCGITDAVLHRKSNGQPYLTGCDLYVSISHCGEMVACAVSEIPVGIDIEHIRPIRLNLVRQVCVEEEKAYLLAGKSPEEDTPCTDRDILERFFEIWTAKEAYFKKCGTGITDLKSVNILTLSRQMHRVDDYMIQLV